MLSRVEHGNFIIASGPGVSIVNVLKYEVKTLIYRAKMNKNLHF